ncbi:U3 snoRNP-associated protein Utp5 [Schizosaccharomyces japonicus yFS275]|uniref:U3 snoRNP-associated protein Utp5 n=1 Tax=Schizosaccharomyces japonicus (strain yFS275 / FY16936) TaxID=402676 RepID=B6K0Y4_SCHJY|nr:U3 snoRNP-associated protein Utp5 [Schizosaccharomyces japonicus yFS275]EEB07605.1 U3 snoRNP-associated protein Utp5 [Schizosaccharomyces japonicus yFS275]
MAPKTRSKSSFQTASIDSGSVYSFNEAGTLFAVVVPGLDAQRLRVFDTSTGSLKSEYAFEKQGKITCFCWGKKARKGEKTLAHEISGAGEVIVVSSENGGVSLYAESLGDVTRNYKFPSIGSITGCSLSGSNGWIMDIDGHLAQIDANSGDVKKQTSIEELGKEFSGLYKAPVRTDLYFATSRNALLLQLPKSEPLDVLTAHTTLIHSLESYFCKEENAIKFATAAASDRFVNLFVKTLPKPEKQQESGEPDSDDTKTAFPHKNAAIEVSAGGVKTAGTLVCDSEISQISLSAAAKQAPVLAALTVDNNVELFEQPWVSTKGAGRGSGALASFSRRNKVNTKKSVLKLRIVRSRGGAAVPLRSLKLLSADTLVLSWVEGARTVFESIQWRLLSSQSVDGVLEIVRSKPQSSVARHGARSTTTYDESNTRVVSGTREQFAASADQADANEASGVDEQEPSLAERLQTLNRIDQQAQSAPLSTKSASASLASVLTQALRTNDNTLLESCFHQQDLATINATIRRLDGTLAPGLLSKLAERMASRPNRAGVLSQWIRAVLIHHAAQLSVVPGLKERLADLFAVLQARAAGFSRLKALQGKLDLVMFQVELRKAGGSKDNAENNEPLSVYYEHLDETIIEGYSDDDEESDSEYDEDEDQDSELSQEGAELAGSDMENDEDEQVVHEDDGSEEVSGDEHMQEDNE